MTLPRNLPSASIAHHNGTSDVFGFCFWLVWFTATTNQSSSCTGQVLPVRGNFGIPLRRDRQPLRFVLADARVFPHAVAVLNTASYIDDIWESEFFASAPSWFKEKLIVPSYGGDSWVSVFFPSAPCTYKEELVVRIVGASTSSYRENIWESEFFQPASSSCKEELLLNVGASTSCHRESIHLTWLILPSAPIGHWNGTSDVKMVLTWEELFLVRVDTASRLVRRENIHVTMLDTLWFFCMHALGLCIVAVLYTNLCNDRCEQPHCNYVVLMEAVDHAKDHYRKSQKPFLWPASRRASGTHNKFTVAALGTSSTGSPVMHAPKYLSVHHPLVRMVLLARDKFDETFACIKSMVLKTIFDMAEILCSFALPNGCKADWNSETSISESPEVGTFSDINTDNTIGKRNELTENESYLSDLGLSGTQHGIKEVKARTSATWVAATAAPHHATGNGDLLSGLVIELDAEFVHAADGVPRKVLARGTVITDEVVLPDVWYVPGLRENLVSVSQLAELDHSVGFGRGECCIRSAGDGKIVGKGRLNQGGHYVLDFLKVPLAI